MRPLKLLKHTLCFLLTICTLFQVTHAQSNTVEVNAPPAPEAAAFGKFGDIPVGEFTGSAQINVPIYNLAHRGFSLPISLNYHSNGIRVSEEAGWVGLGWSLNTGGMITRAVRGFDDFGTQRWTADCGGNPNNYTNYWTLSNNGEIPTGFSEDGIFADSERYLQLAQADITVDYDPSTGYDVIQQPYNINGANYTWEFFCQDGENVKDLESDLYTYNILGYSGKFIIGNDGEIVFLEASDLKVDNITVAGEEDVSWKFITPQGHQVYLGSTRESRQLSYTASRTTTETNGVSTAPDLFNLPCNQPMDSYISTWYIDRIVLTTGEQISFNYAFATDNLYYPVPAFSSNMKDKVGADFSTTNGVPNQTEQPDRIYAKTATLLAYDNVYLSSIDFPAISEQLVFTIQENRPDLLGGILLDEMTVLRGGSVYKSFDFIFDYFESPTTNLDERWDDDFYGENDNQTRLVDGNGNPVIEFDLSGLQYYAFEADFIRKRLRLDAVQEKGNDGSSQVPPHSFSYHGDLPVKTSYAVDHWGHYNGQHTNRSFVPAVTTDVQEVVLLNCGYTPVNDNLIIADRNAQFPFTQAGLLHSIQYPTGGETELTFEGNLYDESGTSNIDRTVEEGIAYRSNNLCTPEAAPSPISFVFNDNDPNRDFNPTATFSWRIKGCVIGTCNSNDCLQIINGAPLSDPSADFEFRIENSNGQEVRSWNWTELGANIITFPSPTGDFHYAETSVSLEGFVDGETYFLSISRTGNTNLPANLLEAELSLTYMRLANTPIVYALSGEEEVEVTVLPAANCQLVPASAPTPFVINDNNGNVNSCARVELSWRILECAGMGCSSTVPCLAVFDDGSEMFEAFFRYVIIDDQGQEIESWNWNNGSGGIQGLPSGTDSPANDDVFLSSAVFDIESLEEGRTYFLKIESFGGSDLPVNLESAQIKVTWPTFEAQEVGQGGGVRIASTTDKTNGQVAQSKTYKYITPTGQASGRLFKEPINYYFSTQGRVVSQQMSYGSELITSSSTHYLNRFSSSVTPLSSSYSGSYVTYSHVRTEYGGGTNGYVDKEFFTANNTIVLTDLNDRSLPLFYNQRSGSILNERYYSASGQLVRSSDYQYNDNWGGWDAPLSADARFTPQYGFRVLTPRVTVSVSSTILTQPVFSRSCLAGLAGPEVYVYAEAPQWHYLESVTNKEYGDDGSFTETVTEYEYENLHYNRVEESITGGGIEWTTKYRYAEELGSCILNFGMSGIPLEVEAPNGVTYRTEYNCIYKVPERFREIYQNGDEILRSSIQGFAVNGYPASISRFGYTAPETYTWKPSPAPQGLLESKSYLDWEEEYQYNDFRQLERSIAIDDQPVEYTYDTHGRLYQIKARPDANSGSGFNVLTTTTYDMGGPNIITNETTYADAPTQTIQSHFDGLGRPTKTVVNGVTKQENQYDAVGRMSASTYLPGSFTRYTYDGSPLNRLTQETYPDGNSVQFTYSAENNEWVTTRLNERGYPTKNYTDILGRESKMEDAIGNITDQAYDAVGRLISISSPAGSYAYTYDDRNRLESKAVPDAGLMTYCYDDATDLLCSSIDANGNRLSWQYDAYQRDTIMYLEEDATTTCNCNTSGERMIANQYDGAGVDEINNPIYRGKLSASWAKMLGASGQTETEYRIDDFGRVERQRDRVTIDGDVFRARQVYTLNQADWLLNTQNIINGIANGANYSHQFNYDDFGRVISENAAGVNTEMKYNDQDQMVYKLYDGGLSRQDYEYNARGWLTDINILRPEVFTEDEVNGNVIADPCQPLTGEDDTYVVRRKVPPAEFFDLLCSGYDVTVPDADLCPPEEPEDCISESYDSRYNNLILNNNLFWVESDSAFTFWSTSREQCGKGDEVVCYPYGWKVRAIEDAEGNVIPLNYDYNIISAYDMLYMCLGEINIIDEAQRLEADLENWLDANGYDYDEVNINVIWGNTGGEGIASPLGVTRAERLEFEVLGSDNFALGDITLEYSLHCYNPFKDEITESFTFLVRKPATVDVELINNCGPIGVYPTGGSTPPPGAAAFEGPIQSSNPAAINFPTKLYEVITEDNRRLWLLEQELQGITTDYRVDKIINVNSAQQGFKLTTTAGQGMVTDLAGLLSQRATDIYLGEVEPDVNQPGSGPSCPPAPLGCDAATQAAQEESLDEVCDKTLAQFAAGTISYPITIAVVQLCNGDITYVLNDLTSLITGNYQVLSTFPLEEDGIEIEVRIEEAIFAMQFAHQENGNIEQIKWKVSNRATSIYDYGYDEIDRVTGSGYSEEYFLDQVTTTPQGLEVASRTLVSDANNRYNTNYSFDGAGNLTSIWRNGVGYSCGPEGQIDKMTLTYGGPAGNQLVSVLDEAPANLIEYGFKPRQPDPSHGTLQYQYDFNGNMTYDPHKLLDITYNHLNLPERVSKGSTDVLTTLYDAAG
ncbi:MAG: hypothetical protein AAFN81_03840, partial [Bacteroidota bacterium]